MIGVINFYYLPGLRYDVLSFSGGGDGVVDGCGVAAWAVKEVLITVAKDFARYIRLYGGRVRAAAAYVWRAWFFFYPPPQPVS